MTYSNSETALRTNYEYNCLGLIYTSMNDFSGIKNDTNYYTYDYLGNIVIKNGSAVSKIYYDELGRKIKETDEMGKTEYMEYDGAGNLIKHIDRNGQITAFTYDLRNRILSKTCGQNRAAYTYDNVGNVISVTDNNGVTNYEYYENGNLKKETLPDGKYIYYEYDNNNNKIKVIDQYGKTIFYGYDTMNRLTTVTTDGASSVYTYYPDGSRKSINYPGETTEKYVYDGLNNLISIVNTKSNGEIIEYDNYTYDGLNNLISITNKKRNDGIIDYYKYTYDVAGNQLTKTNKSGTISYTYDTLGRLLTTTEQNGIKTSYTYRKGNILSKIKTNTAGAPVQKINYTYDANDKLITSTEINNNGTENITNFTYDNNGNMLSKTITHKSNGVATATEVYGYSYNELNQLVEFRNPNGAKFSYTYYSNGLRRSSNNTQYYYDGDNVIIETVNGNFSARNIWGINPIARQKDGATFYYLYNGHADVVALVDAAGNVLNSYDYDEYGNIKEANEVGTNNPIKYAGQYYDNESGLYYLRARYYDPELMRFISEDANKGDVKDPLSLNLYVYCVGNPVRYYDLDGHEKICAMSDLIFNGGGDLITVVYLISQLGQEYLTNGAQQVFLQNADKVVAEGNRIKEKLGGGSSNQDPNKNKNDWNKVNFVNKTTKSYWKDYDKLSKNIQKVANDKFKLFQENPYHNGLGFHKLQGYKDIWAVRINDQHRVIGIMKDGVIKWVRIIPHNYNILDVMKGVY